MRRLRALLPLLLLIAPLLPALALGQDPPPGDAGGGGGANLPPGIEYALGVSPTLALAYVAWMFGKGFAISIEIRPAEPLMLVLTRIAVAMENGAKVAEDAVEERRTRAGRGRDSER